MRSYINIIFLIGLVIVAPVSLADTTPITVFLNARIIDGTGQPAIDNGTMIISGTKIDKVIKGLPINLPKHAIIINLSGKTIIPTLIDTHMHLGQLNGTVASEDNITVANDLRQLKRYLDYGVGVILSLGRDPDFIYTLRAQRQQGKIPGPYIFTAGRGFGVVNGAPPFSKLVYRPTSIAQVNADMAELAKHHPDIVKIWVDDWGGTMPKMQPDIYQAIIKAAHQHGLRVAAHIYYLADAKTLVNDGVDILEHSVRDLPVDEELIASMKQHHVALVPTLGLNDGFFIYADKPTWMYQPFFKNALEPGVFEMLTSSKFQPRQSERKTLLLAEHNLKALYDAGVTIGFGTDSGALPTRVQGFAEHRELQLMVNAGLTPLQALTIATGTSAKLLNIADKMGTLQSGKLANFIILDANPLENINNTEQIHQVWLDGKLASYGPVKAH